MPLISRNSHFLTPPSLKVGPKPSDISETGAGSYVWAHGLLLRVKSMFSQASYTQITFRTCNKILHLLSNHVLHLRVSQLHCPCTAHIFVLIQTPYERPYLMLIAHISDSYTCHKVTLWRHSQLKLCHLIIIRRS